MHIEAYEANDRSMNQKEKMHNRLRILIVDDEPKILRGLSLMISKINRPATHVMCANGAEAALNAVQSFNPDVVITDICMPCIDGFELIDKIREISSCKRYVILSGYSDFEYARTAIKKKAMDYLLKPVDEAALQKLLLRTKSELLQDMQNDRRFMIYTLKDIIFYGTPLNKKFLDKQFGSIFLYPQFLVAVFKYADHLHEDMQQILKQPFYELSSIVELINHPNHRITVILSNVPESVTKTDVQEIYKGFGNIIRNNTHCPPYIGMSELGTNILQLNKLYLSATRDTLVSQYFSDKRFEDQRRLNSCLGYFFNYIDCIFETGNLPETHEDFTLMIDELIPNLQDSEDWDNLYLVIKTSVQSMLNDRKDILEKTSIITEINWMEQYGASNSEKMAKAIYRMLSSIFHPRQRNKKDKITLIRNMTGFIHSNYMNSNVTLVDMAKFVHMHPKYVSTVFSKNVGMTFGQYLNHYRISKAKNIMEE